MATAPRKRIAVTMDDFNLPEDVDHALERDLRIRSHLKQQAAGFVSGKYSERAAFDTVLANWAADGHILANHTYNHWNSSAEDTDKVWSDIQRNHRLLKDRLGFEPYFRFPFLAEGRDAAQRDDYYARLREAGYTPAPVTVDSADWNITQRLERDGADKSAVGAFYADFTLQAAEYAHRLAVLLGYPDAPHPLLVHHNALNALYLGDMLDRLRSEGWEVVDAKLALDHPLNAGGPPENAGWGDRLELLRRDAGIERPDYPDVLRDFGNPAMDALGL